MTDNINEGFKGSLSYKINLKGLSVVMINSHLSSYKLDFRRKQIDEIFHQTLNELHKHKDK